MITTSRRNQAPLIYMLKILEMLKTKVRGIEYRGKSRKHLSDYVEEDKKLLFRTTSDKYRYFYTGHSLARIEIHQKLQ